MTWLTEADRIEAALPAMQEEDVRLLCKAVRQEFELVEKLCAVLADALERG